MEEAEPRVEVEGEPGGGDEARGEGVEREEGGQFEEGARRGYVGEVGPQAGVVARGLSVGVVGWWE